MLVAGCSGTDPDAAPSAAPTTDPLDEMARRNGAVGVIVQLAVPQERPGIWDRREIAREQQKLLDFLGAGADVVERYEELPQVALEVTPRGLRRLRAYPNVTNISLNTVDEAAD